MIKNRNKKIKLLEARKLPQHIIRSVMVIVTAIQTKTHKTQTLHTTWDTKVLPKDHTWEWLGTDKTMKNTEKKKGTRSMKMNKIRKISIPLVGKLGREGYD